MNYRNIFIVGAGPAGLACTYYLSKYNFKINTFEQNKSVGGLARSWNWNGFNLDTGPHIFHTPIKEIENDWKDLFNDLLIRKDFYACNYREKRYYDYPLNLEQLSQYKEFQDDVEKLKSKKNFGDLASATNYEDYVNKLVGKKLSKAFFKEYPEKLWGIKTNEMSSEWAPKRIRLTNKREKFFGQEYTAIGKRGTGEIMERLALEAEKNGCEIYKNCKVKELTIKESNNILSINSIKTSSRGEIKVGDQDLVILTIPITKALNLIGHTSELKFRGTLSIYLELDKKINIIPDKYDWLYFQNKENLVNRLCCPTNWSDKIDITGKERSLLAAEISVDDNIKPKALKSILRNGNDYLEEIIKNKKGKVINSTYNLERFVYPVKMLNTKEKIAKAKKIFAEISNLEILGTGANFNYGDMQIMFLKAKELSKEINSATEKSLSKISFIERYKGKFKALHDYSRSIKIIAELGINHNGSIEELHSLIKEASKSGAKYIKFQHYKNKERINENSIENKLIEKAQDIEESTFDILEENKLTLNQLFEAKQITEQCGCIPMTTVFGQESLKEALSLGFKNIKVASMDLNNFELHHFIISNKNKIDDIFISTGMSSLDEISTTLKIYERSNILPILLACTSSYPASDGDLNLLNIKTLKNEFKNCIKDIGYSDHSIGNLACIISASLGANYLEVHFTNSKKTRGPDHILSATPEELNELRKELNRLEKMMGSRLKVPRPSEYETWRLQKKGLYAKKDIIKGEKVYLNNVEIKSPPYGMLVPTFLNKNYIASKNILAGEVINSENISDIENKKS